MTKAEREARLRAVRRMQDNVYDDIGTPSDMRPDVGGDDGPSRGDRARADARRMARSLTQGGVDDADLSGIDNPRLSRRSATTKSKSSGKGGGSNDRSAEAAARAAAELRRRRNAGTLTEEEYDRMRRLPSRRR